MNYVSIRLEISQGLTSIISSCPHKTANLAYNFGCILIGSYQSICRIVFSAHAHEFCDHTHLDGTREITVPAMSWDARDDPGFVVATFRKRKAELAITHCFLARESHVLLAYISSLFLLILTMSLQTHTFHNVEFMVREFIS